MRITDKNQDSGKLSRGFRISECFPEKEYSKFREYCASSNIIYLDELMLIDYVVFQRQSKTSVEFCTKIRVRVDEILSGEVIITRDTGITDTQQYNMNLSSQKSTNNLHQLLTGQQYSVLLEQLQEEGILTIEQFRQRFGRNSLMRYLNAHDLYLWQERVKIAQDVSSILGVSGTERSESKLKPPDPRNFQDGGMLVDFNCDTNYQFTTPIKAFLGGVDQPVSNWTEFLVQLCEYMIANHPAEMLSLISNSILPGSSRAYIRSDKANGLASKKLSNGSWVITHYNATTLVQLAKAICLSCNHPLADIIVYYQKTPLKNRKQRPTRKPRIVREKRAQIYKGPKTSFEVSKEQLEPYIISRGLSGCSIDEIVIGTGQKSRTAAAVKRYIDSNNQIVEVKPGRYTHKSCIVDIDEAAEELLNILQTQFVQFDGYTNNCLLFEAARINLSLFMNDNAFEDDETIYNLAKHLFSKECFGGYHFVFYGNAYIWEKEPNYPKSVKGLLIHQARLAGGKISRSEGEAYLEKIKMVRGNYSQVVLNTEDSTFYQYAPGESLLSESLKIDEEWKERIKKPLVEFFEKNAFVIPRDISETWYEQLPQLPLGLPWTPLLLQEVLRFNSPIGFRPISAPLAQARDTIAAAIVPTDSVLTTFADVVSAYLRDTIELPRRMEAEELRLVLREAGMLDGNELIYNMHKALDDFRFAWSNDNASVYILRE